MSEIPELKALPTRDLDEVRTAALRAQAKAVLRQETARRSAGDALAGLWHRGEPLLVAALAVLYIGWAFMRTMAH